MHACILFSDLKDRKAASVRSIYRLYEEASGVGLVILQEEHLYGAPLRKCFDNKGSLLSIRWEFTHETVAQLREALGSLRRCVLATWHTYVSLTLASVALR